MSLAGINDNPVAVMALFDLVMLVAGFFLDSASAIIVLSPLLPPIAAQVGVDPVHFGIITLVNFSVGMITPPVGLNLFVAMAIARMSLGEVFRRLPTLHPADAGGTGSTDLRALDQHGSPATDLLTRESSPRGRL